jgi:hypothetical protein
MARHSASLRPSLAHLFGRSIAIFAASQRLFAKLSQSTSASVEEIKMHGQFAKTISRRNLLRWMGGMVGTGLIAAWSSSLPAFARQSEQTTGNDLSTLYDQATLEYWGSRYQRSTTRILDEIVWPVLLSEEKLALRGKPRLEFPQVAAGLARNHPLAFYVPASGDRIIFPMLSLKFLDDLCTAYAWLQINDYSLETISEYTAILAYSHPPPEGFPPPLEALGITENALDNRAVDELALGHFVTARTFILLHEMGHIRHRHGERSTTEPVKKEQEADLFAVTVMKRTSLPPLGIVVYFLADAHWSGFPASGSDTHPLSGTRVAALADHVDDPKLAQNLRQLGEFFDDPDIRAGFVATGREGDLAALCPRRVGELPQHCRTPLVLCGNLLTGTYRGEFVQFSEADALAIELVLERYGDNVTGTFTFGLGFGRLIGTIRNSKLDFDWMWVSNYGKGSFTAQADGSFTGTWGYRENRSGAGTWSGQCGLAFNSITNSLSRL